MLKLRKNKKGFTLVELIVVIAIMAVLAGTVAGVTVSQLNKQTNNTAKSEAKSLAPGGLDIYVRRAVVARDVLPRRQKPNPFRKFTELRFNLPGDSFRI